MRASLDCICRTENYNKPQFCQRDSVLVMSIATTSPRDIPLKLRERASKGSCRIYIGTVYIYI